MPQDPIQLDSANTDFSHRIIASKTVVASPALAAETVIGSLSISENEQVVSGILLDGWAAFTVGTSGASARLRIRETDINGTVVADTGATTGGIAAGNLVILDAHGQDVVSNAGGRTYVLTLQIGSGAAASTVSAVSLKATVV